MKAGRTLLTISILTRFAVLLLLGFLALTTEYLNLKVAYNLPRLVELSSGKAMRVFYEAADRFYGWFGDPLESAQQWGGMTWSIRVMGVPFTDPVAAVSVLAKDRRWTLGFGLGLVFPLALAVLCGRVFCAYICPASLMFFTVSRLRRLLEKWFYFPDWDPGRGVAWGILLGGTLLALA